MNFKSKILSCLLAAVICLQYIAGVVVFADDSTEWTYTDYGEGIAVTGYSGNDDDVFVPADIDGKKVVKIGDGAFRNNMAINSVTLSSNITAIGESAFEGASNMVCIVTNDALTEIGENAFAGCKKFNSVILKDNVTSIGNNAFSNCPILRIYCNENNTAYRYAKANGVKCTLLDPDAEPERVIQDGVSYYITNGEAIVMANTGGKGVVTIPATIEGYPVTRINASAFADNYNLSEDITKIILPETITEIGGQAFEGANVEEVVLSDSIENIGDSVFSSCKKLKSLTLSKNMKEIPAGTFSACTELENIIIPEGITEIGHHAFSECKGLKYISFPNTLALIKERAFSGCTNLEEIYLPDSVSIIEDAAFGGCRSLQKVRLSAGLTELSRDVFCDCDALQEVIIPDSITTIINPFMACSSLKNLTIPKTVTAMELSTELQPILHVYKDTYAEQYAKNNNLVYIVIDGDGGEKVYEQDGVTYYIKDGEAILFGCDHKKTGAVTIPKMVGGYNVTRIENNAFCLCEYITSVSLPDTIKEIGNYAFNLCWLMESINLPEGLESIGSNAFYASGLKSVTVPSSISELNNAFQGCEELANVTLPDNMTEIGDNAFVGCYELKNIKLPSKLKKIGFSAFSETGFEDFIIPNSVTDVGESAFLRCKKLKNVVWPSAANEIHADTFRGCVSLSSVTLNSNITTIDSGAFCECNQLYEITIPKSVSKIEDEAFDSYYLKTKINAYDKSTALSYAETNNFIYSVIDGNQGTEIYNDGTFVYIVENGEASVAYCLLDTFDTSTGVKRIAANQWVGTSAARKKDLELTIPNKINGYPVISIRQNAFTESMAIKSIRLPDSITKIDDFAFRLSLIENVEMSSELQHIGMMAFEHCVLLKNVDLPNSVTTIEDGAFGGCESFTEFSVPKSIIKLGGVLGDCYNLESVLLPEGLKYIPAGMFDNCESLVTIDIPETVEVIEGGFSGCCRLKSLNIPEGVKEIGTKTFAGCQSLESITVPEGVKEIGTETFAGCQSLESITIPKSVTSIAERAILGCYSLKNLFISDKVTKIGMYNGDDRTLRLYDDNFSGCPNLVICTYQDSAAHKYAEAHGLYYFILPQSDNPYKANGHSISGTVTSVRGNAIGGATVEFTDKYGNVREQVKTNEYGEYSFGYAEVGKYTIRATLEGANSGTDSFGVRRKNVFDTLLVGNTNITIQDAVTVHGVVTDKNGNPTKAAGVSVIDEEGMIVAEFVTDSNGRYNIGNIPNGEYIIRAQKSGSAATSQVKVYAPDGDLECNIELGGGGSVSGTVVKEDGSAAVWTEIIVSDSYGNRVTSLYTNNEGKYVIDTLPYGSYGITAVLQDSGERLDGTGFVTVNSGKTAADTITLQKSNNKGEGATIYGRTTDAQGETHETTVVIRDIFLNEIAACHTGENGKYKFKDLRDGTYAVIAFTDSYSAGYSTVVVKDGRVVLGSPNVFMYKARAAYELEQLIDTLPSADDDYQTIRVAKSQITEAKNIYNRLNYLEKKSVDAEYLKKLNSLTEIAAPNVSFREYHGEFNFRISGIENLIADEEIENEATAEIEVEVSEITDLLNDDENIEVAEAVELIEERANEEDMTVIDCINIDLTKSSDGTEKEIKNITKDSVGTDKVQITLDIPEEYRGHENYSMLHMHNGDIVTLVDIDDNPDTITFETDKFSQYALAYDDNVRASANNLESSVSYDDDTKTVNVISDQNIKGAKVIFAAYLEGRLVSLQVKEVDFVEGVNEPVIADDFDTSNSDSVKVMIWRDFNSMMPLFDY